MQSGKVYVACAIDFVGDIVTVIVKRERSGYTIRLGQASTGTKQRKSSLPRTKSPFDGSTYKI